MKVIYLTILTILIAATTFAQKPDKVLARVRYTYTNEKDTVIQTKKPRTENMLLFIGKNASLFTSYDKITYELAEDQKSMARSIAGTGGGNRPVAVKIDRSAGDWLSKINHTFFIKEKKMFILENVLGQGYLMEEPIAEIKWKISKDTTTLSGVACQKATTTYDHKNWTVWFAPSLPFQSGPWKLQGLPGLILQAFTDDKTTQYQFAGFENAKEGDFIRVNDTKKRPNYEPGDISTVDVGMGLDVAGAYFENIIQLPTYRTVKTTRKELDKLIEAYKKDPRAFSRALNGF